MTPVSMKDDMKARTPLVKQADPDPRLCHQGGQSSSGWEPFGFPGYLQCQKVHIGSGWNEGWKRVSGEGSWLVVRKEVLRRVGGCKEKGSVPVNVGENREERKSKAQSGGNQRNRQNSGTKMCGTKGVGKKTVNRVGEWEDNTPGGGTATPGNPDPGGGAHGRTDA